MSKQLKFLTRILAGYVVSYQWRKEKFNDEASFNTYAYEMGIFSISVLIGFQYAFILMVILSIFFSGFFPSFLAILMSSSFLSIPLVYLTAHLLKKKINPVTFQTTIIQKINSENCLGKRRILKIATASHIINTILFIVIELPVAFYIFNIFR